MYFFAMIDMPKESSYVWVSKYLQLIIAYEKGCNYTWECTTGTNHAHRTWYDATGVPYTSNHCMCIQVNLPILRQLIHNSNHPPLSHRIPPSYTHPPPSVSFNSSQFPLIVAKMTTTWTILTSHPPPSRNYPPPDLPRLPTSPPPPPSTPPNATPPPPPISSRLPLSSRQ